MIYGTHEKNTLDQFQEVSNEADKACLMADGHLGYVMPIGGVAAYKNKLSPVNVGFDIACGNMAIRLDKKANDINLDSVLDGIESKVNFGVGRTNPDAPKDHELFDSELWDAYPHKEISVSLKELARNQLGTVGSGNHYVDVFEDAEGFIWVGVHFGSRGLGHKTASGFLSMEQNGIWDGKAKEVQTFLDIHSELGEMYYRAMQLCGLYAYAGREWVCQTVQDIIGANRTHEVHNHHNYTWDETYDGQRYFVVRKGATPAFPGQEGFIGGSMGDDAVIVEGLESEKSKNSLYSTVHGAGRVMSRTEAAGKRKWIRGEDGKKRPQRVRPGKISREMLEAWLRDKNVKLRGGGLDEAPQAYRRLKDVLKCHEGTIKINHTLKPIGVVMAGENDR
ncbi:hypothetical protein LCGC14_2693260, partial [marine sediment metagenome]